MDPVSIIGWIVFGLIVGLIARLLVPGPDPMGWVATILLGIVGSLVGGFIGWALGFRDPYQAGGWILSVVGAIIVLVVYHWAMAARART